MSKKILIIDDEKNILLTLNLILRNEGYDVFIASDSLEGVIKAGEIKPNLILNHSLTAYSYLVAYLVFVKQPRQHHDPFQNPDDLKLNRKDYAQQCNSLFY